MKREIFMDMPYYFVAAAPYSLRESLEVKKENIIDALRDDMICWKTGRIFAISYQIAEPRTYGFAATITEKPYNYKKCLKY